MRHRNTEIIEKILHIVKVFAHNVKKQPQLSGKAMQSHLMIYAVISTVTDMKHCWHQQWHLTKTAPVLPKAPF